MFYIRCESIFKVYNFKYYYANLLLNDNFWQQNGSLILQTQTNRDETVFGSTKYSGNQEIN